MTGDRQHLIRKRAHEIWEAEGYPHGQHERHWEQATHDVDGHRESDPVTATEAELAAKGSLASEPVLNDGLVGGDLSALAGNENNEKAAKRKRPAPVPRSG